MMEELVKMYKNQKAKLISVKSLYQMLIFGLVICAQQTSFAATINKEQSVEFLNKYSNVINGRNYSDFKTFIEYYAIPEARFIITTYKVDANKPDEQILSNQGVNLSRDEFIELWRGKFKTAKRYSYRIKNIEFTQYSDNQSALVAASSEEAILRMDKESADSATVEKVLISTNCNLLLSMPVTEAQIQGLNCVEKVAVKALESGM